MSAEMHFSLNSVNCNVVSLML